MQKAARAAMFFRCYTYISPACEGDRGRYAASYRRRQRTFVKFAKFVVGNYIKSPNPAKTPPKVWQSQKLVVSLQRTCGYVSQAITIV